MSLLSILIYNLTFKKSLSILYNLKAMIEKYKHIIWDWNGTLLNDVLLSVDIINKILTERNLKPLSEEKYKDIFTFPVKEYYQAAGIDLGKFSFEELGKEWINEYDIRRSEADLHKGVVEVLEFIRSKKIGQSILSAYSQDALEDVVNQFNLKKYFTYLVGLDHIYATSKIGLGKKLMKILNHESADVLLIGDTIHDFKVAREIGADCILVANGHQSSRRLLTCGVPVQNNLDEILSI